MIFERVGYAFFAHSATIYETGIPNLREQYLLALSAFVPGNFTNFGNDTAQFRHP